LRKKVLFGVVGRPRRGITKRYKPCIALADYGGIRVECGEGWGFKGRLITSWHLYMF
jgi:hypothetical protein